MTFDVVTQEVGGWSNITAQRSAYSTTFEVESSPPVFQRLREHRRPIQKNVGIPPTRTCFQIQCQHTIISLFVGYVQGISRSHRLPAICTRASHPTQRSGRAASRSPTFSLERRYANPSSASSIARVASRGNAVPNERKDR